MNNPLDNIPKEIVIKAIEKETQEITKQANEQLKKLQGDVSQISVKEEEVK